VRTRDTNRRTCNRHLEETFVTKCSPAHAAIASCASLIGSDHNVFRQRVILKHKKRWIMKQHDTIVSRPQPKSRDVWNVRLSHRLSRRRTRGGNGMRGTLILVITALAGGAALAQNAPPISGPTNNPAANATASKPALAAPAQPQPQGHTGPTATTSGGAPGSSPQGDSPPGMQPHPNDRKQDIVPKKLIVDSR
jgi:hypothetical protein